MPRALENIRVVDLSHVLAAPTCTMFLADLGAEVIHVEPLHGDDAREFGPFAGSGGKNNSGYFISLNRNKKSLAIDLKQDKGKKILTDLIKVSDVVVENFRPNTMRKLGFGWEELQAINPRVIYASISGFGQDTLPGYDTRPSYDMVAQGYSGLMSITGPEGGPPCRVGSSVGDIFAGHQAAIGVLAALLHREKTGRGQHFDGAMIDGLFTVLENAVVRYTINGEIPKPLGSAHPTIVPFQSFPTKDDSHVIIALGNDNLWKSFCKLIGREDLAEHAQVRHQPAENPAPQGVGAGVDPGVSEAQPGGVAGAAGQGQPAPLPGQQREGNLRGPPHRPPQDAGGSRPARGGENADRGLPHPPVRNPGGGLCAGASAGPAFGGGPADDPRVLR